MAGGRLRACGDAAGAPGAAHLFAVSASLSATVFEGPDGVDAGAGVDPIVDPGVGAGGPLTPASAAAWPGSPLRASRSHRW
eukprot:263309-Chlamydomonas_euryale.AAC.1